ncbi:Na+/H+ antiporter NhaC family protein [Spiroplasma eriocheiris]|uniref:Sodium:proton antiporter n=1 Tax=Spiroplasma eriocheiris TaxID=315358 RepID=A0A0H3XK66_9MOLU|nr:Na+/H+ antiporter NhaC family protein [Spiroplasma eriocheiris]AHF57819.1 putative Na+/H+ antiporter [Spiroplasma eriocheiris CCTCC M 207170]AKM54266.1 sodium:proton antiporter [Spiroplasma eriocheiris]
MARKTSKINKLLANQEVSSEILTLKREVSFKGLIPLLLFVILFIICGIVLDCLKYQIFSKHNPMGFYLVFAPIIILVPIIIGFIIINGDFNLKLKAFLKGSSDHNILLMVFIYLLSGMFSQLMTTIGASSAIGNLGFKIIPPSILVGGVFIISAVISTAMGTSVGTIVAFGPIAFGMAKEAHINPAMIGGALLCGAMFGDDLSLISDTAIASCRTQNVEPRKRFLFNFKILLIPALIAIVLYFTLTYLKDAQSHAQTWIWWKALLTILPFIIVLISALAGVNVFIVLILGTLMALIIGFSLNQFNYWVLPNSSDLTTNYLPNLSPALMTNGSFDPNGHLLSGVDKFLVAMDAMKNGMINMNEIIFLALFTGGLAGLSELSGGVEWAIQKINKAIKGKKSAQFGIAMLTSVSDIALANNTIAIIIAGPVAKKIRETHQLNKNKIAAFVSIFPAVFQGLIPYGAQMLMLVGLANSYVDATTPAISFLDVWTYSWYLYLLFAFAMLFIIFSSWERILTYPFGTKFKQFWLKILRINKKQQASKEEDSKKSNPND